MDIKTRTSYLDPIPDYHEKVEKAAYYLSEKRGFEPGHELEDWFEAERIIKLQWLL